MRHKYFTEAVVLSRYPFGEAGCMTTILTKDFGLVVARAEGVRRSGAKLSHALQTLSESDVTLVHGREGWRITGAYLKNCYPSFLSRSARGRVSKVSGLLQRLFGSGIPDARVYEDFITFVNELQSASQEKQDALETLMTLKLLLYLGSLSVASVPQGFGEASLVYAKEHRAALVREINKGIQSSGL